MSRPQTQVESMSQLNQPTNQQLKSNIARLERIKSNLFEIWVQFVDFQGPQPVEVSRKRNFFDKNYTTIIRNFITRCKVIDKADEQIEELFGQYIDKFYHAKQIKRSFLLMVQNPKRWVLSELTTYMENPQNKFILEKIRKNFDNSKIVRP